MNTNHLTTLRWNDLVNPKMIGKYILVEYWSSPQKRSINIYDRSVEILGTAYVGNDRVLLVRDHYADDIYIIMRDGQGYLWDAYQEI